MHGESRVRRGIHHKGPRLTRTASGAAGQQGAGGNCAAVGQRQTKKGGGGAVKERVGVTGG